MASAADEVARAQALHRHDVQLAAIVRSVKQAVISVDETQTIVLFNPEAEAIFRCTAAQALGGPLERFIPVSARAAHRAHVANYDGRSAQAARSMGGERILTGLRADGEAFPIDASISCTEDAGRKWYTVILRDVTERVRTQQELLRYADIVESSSDAILSRTLQGKILTWNGAAAHIFGYTRDEALHMAIDDLYSPNTPPTHRELTQLAIRGQPVVNVETIRRRKDGSDVNVAITISLMRDRDGQVIGSSAIFRDITRRVHMERELRESLRQQKQAEVALRESRDSLRELSAALQAVREEEKTRIARELHDELGQALTALKMDAAAIAEELPPAHASTAKRAQGMMQLIDTTVRSVRRIAADLRPMMLDNLGLVPTLEWLARDFAVRGGIAVDLVIPDEDLGASGDAATAVFRIVQEALTNVARHAQASAVRVEVLRREGNVQLCVRDNGVGMRKSGERKAQSYGVLGMRERAYVLGGSFKIESTPGAGTTIEASIPVFGNVRGQAS